VASAPGWDKWPNIDGWLGVIQYQEPATRVLKLLSHRGYDYLVGNWQLMKT
jgi:hypothetical protein